MIDFGQFITRYTDRGIGQSSVHQGLAGVREGLRARDQRARDAVNQSHLQALEEQAKERLAFDQEKVASRQEMEQRKLQAAEQARKVEQEQFAIQQGMMGNPMWASLLPQESQPPPGAPPGAPPGGLPAPPGAPPPSPVDPLTGPEPSLDEVIAHSAQPSSVYSVDAPMPLPAPKVALTPEEETEILDSLAMQGVKEGGVPSADDLIGMLGIDAEGNEYDMGVVSPKTAGHAARVSSALVDSARIVGDGLDPNDPFAVAKATNAARVARAVTSIPGGEKYAQFAQDLVSSGTAPDKATAQVTRMILADRKAKEKARKKGGGGTRMKPVDPAIVPKGDVDFKALNYGRAVVKDEINANKLKGWRTDLDNLAHAYEDLGKRGPGRGSQHNLAIKRLIRTVESRITDEDFRGAVGEMGLMDSLVKAWNANVKNLGKEKGEAAFDAMISEFPPQTLDQLRETAGKMESILSSRVDDALESANNVHEFWVGTYKDTGKPDAYWTARGIEDAVVGAFGKGALEQVSGKKEAASLKKPDDEAKALLEMGGY